MTELVDRLRAEEGRRAVRLANSLQMGYAHREDVRTLLREAAAEIEALRAIIDNREAIIATHAADTREYQKHLVHAEARAERLAEALKCLNSATRRYMEERPVSDAEWASDEPSVLSIVDAALEQEEGK